MPPPTSIPDHTLRHPIGRGAYGEVWLARNVMGAPRAVKLVWRRQFESDRPYEREFAGMQRYEPVSRSADGLVHVLHVGRNNAQGYFYCVMELADAATPPPVESEGELRVESSPPAPASLSQLSTRGPLNSYSPRTLRSDLKRLGRLSVADCRRVALDIVGGLARLHDCGLVHRDVKPGNIIFVEGRAKLADIGLVSRGGEGRTFVGTEGYIPPEGPGSATADLYALGMVLYEAVTGYPPERFPQVPSEWFTEEADTESLEFHEVVLKACEGARERRYQSAEEMQADLALLQSGQSVRRMRTLERRAARTQRFAWAALIVVMLAVATAFLANWRARMAQNMQQRESSLLQEARDAREKEMGARARAENAERDARQQLYAALLEQARATVRSGEMGQRVRALEAIRRAAAISNSTELRREVLAALALPDLRFERELPIGPDFTLQQLNPTFERIALCRGQGPVEIRAVADDRWLATLPASTNLMCYSAKWSGDGRFLAANRDCDSSGYRSDLEVWDLKDTPRRVLLIRDARWKARAFHPSRPQFLAGGADGLMVAWDLEKGKELARGKFDATAQVLAYSPNGKSVAASYQRTDGWGASVHNAADGVIVCSNVFASRIASLDWHPSGRWIALSDFSGAIHLMDSRTGETRLLGRHKGEAVLTAFNADGRYLITGAWGRELICWDVVRRQRAFSIDVESFVAQFRADGLACAIWTASGVQLYAFERPAAHRELPEELTPHARHAAFSPDGRWLAASSDERFGVWDLASGGPGAFADYAADARPFWTADGRELFGSGARNNDCFRWRVHPATNASAPPLLERMRLHKPDKFNSLCVASNLVAWTSFSGTRIDRLEQVTLDEDRWVPTTRGINGISGDSRWLAVYGSYSPFMSVYQLPELQPVARLTNQGRISGFSFSPSGDELAITSNGQVEFWSTKNWGRTRIATNFIGLSYVGTLFQPGGRALWLAKNFRSAGLYDSETFAPLLPLQNGMFPLALSPDGRQLIVSVEGRRLQLWDMNTFGRELARLGLDW